MTPIGSGSQMNRRHALAALAVVAASPHALAGPQDQRREVVIVEKATEALVEITRSPTRGLPLSLLRRRKASSSFPTW